MKTLFELMARYPSNSTDKVYIDVGSRRFINVTDRCNLKCEFCPRMQPNSVKDTKQLPSEPSLTRLIDAVCATSSCSEVVFTGVGEPTYRLYDILKAARYLQTRGTRVVLDTNGLADRIYNRTIAPDLEDNIDEINIKLNGHDAVTYENVCHPNLAGAFASVLEFIQSASEYVPKVNIVSVTGIPEINLDAMQALADRLGVGFKTATPTQPC